MTNPETLNALAEKIEAAGCRVEQNTKTLARQSRITLDGETFVLDVTRKPTTQSWLPAARGNYRLRITNCTILSEDSQRLDTLIVFGPKDTLKALAAREMPND